MSQTEIPLNHDLYCLYIYAIVPKQYIFFLFFFAFVGVISMLVLRFGNLFSNIALTVLKQSA